MHGRAVDVLERWAPRIRSAERRLRTLRMSLAPYLAVYVIYALLIWSGYDTMTFAARLTYATLLLAHTCIFLGTIRDILATRRRLAMLREVLDGLMLGLLLDSASGPPAPGGGSGASAPAASMAGTHAPSPYDRPSLLYVVEMPGHRYDVIHDMDNESGLALMRMFGLTDDGRAAGPGAPDRPAGEKAGGTDGAHAGPAPDGGRSTGARP